MSECVYVLTKDGHHYGVFTTMEKAKERAAQITMGWYGETGEEAVANSQSALWRISAQRVED